MVKAVRRENPDPTAPGLWCFAISEGATYEFSEYKDMLERAGFNDIIDVNTQAIKAPSAPSLGPPSPRSARDRRVRFRPPLVKRRTR